MKFSKLFRFKGVPKVLPVAVALVAAPAVLAPPMAAATPPAAGATAAVQQANTAAATTKTPMKLQTVTAYAAEGNTTAAPLVCSLWAGPLEVISPPGRFGPFDVSFYTALGGTSWVTCTGPVAGIEVAAALAWDGLPVSIGPPITRAGTNVAAYAYAADVCSSGDWQVGGDAIIQWPPEYRSPPGHMSGFAPARYVDPVTCV